MQQSRRHRFIATLLALISVLFTQLAVAAYVCPSMQIGQAMESIAALGAKVDHAMAGCDGMDSEQPVLCQNHGQVSHQSLDKPELPDVAPFIATTLVQAVGFADIAYQDTTTSPSANLSLKRSTAPPLSIRNCCFRI
jgi:hypothetical protein